MMRCQESARTRDEYRMVEKKISAKRERKWDEALTKACSLCTTNDHSFYHQKGRYRLNDGFLRTLERKLSHIKTQKIQTVCGVIDVEVK